MCSRCSEYSRKQTDELTDFVRRPQIGAKGLVYLMYGADGSLKSSADKFYSPEDLRFWVEKAGARPGDLILTLQERKRVPLQPSPGSVLRWEEGLAANRMYMLPVGG